jgi:hypothetical protein
MSNYHNIDSFEQFLRNSTKDFKMTPHKRVWFSIYNHIHPSKNLPSILTALFFLFIFFSIDFLNTSKSSIKTTQTQTNIKSSKKIVSSLLSSQNIQLNVDQRLLLKNKKNTIQQIEFNINEKDSLNIITNHDNFEIQKCDLLKEDNNPISFDGLIVNNQINENNFKNKSIDKLVYNKKDFNNFSYEIHATPSMSINNLKNRNQATGIEEINEVSENKKQRFRYSDLNLNAGGAILYQISNSFRIKAGLELIYTRASFSNVIEENNESDFNKQTNVSNNYFLLSDNQNGLLELNSYRISLPIGSEFELAGNDRVHWYAGASIEPTYKIYDNPVSNITNYLPIYEQFKLNKFNLNSNFETYLSLRINKNSYFNAGPQFRYQLFSGNNNLSNSFNNPYNFGMKFGISKTF